jgi:hypothetical protein
MGSLEAGSFTSDPEVTHHPRQTERTYSMNGSAQSQNFNILPRPTHIEGDAW